MTAQGRTWIALVALFIGGALIIVGVVQTAPEATASGASVLSLVLGYVFGDRNGEKRLANAMTVLQADAVTKG